MNREKYLNLFEKYIENKATEEEIEALVLFIRTHPQINDWIELQISNSPSEISAELKQNMFKKIQEKINETEKQNKPDRVILRFLRIAAAILLPVFIVWGGYYFYNKQNEQEQAFLMTAEPGEKANVSLPDGSRVWLNSGSKLTCYNSYNKDNRLLQLDGEAYFEVASDAKRKFIVRCTDMQVEVLGTTFGVKAFDEDSILSIVLVEGKVKITVPDGTREMKPNERIVYNKSDKKLSSCIVDPNDFTDWRKNRLRFENETLQDIARTISRIHNVDYIFADETIKNLRFTGSVDNTNIVSILDAITLTASITYTVKDSLIIFHREKSK
ncbi:MAG: FecR domain-containing protein [Tannerella sp.]|jgi:ferric-dicitrate binding protein FerR (iron transport regulator)|nr:FecR domain-containing protein [Tannerella sp.]